jgi:hypothetical protein
VGKIIMLAGLLALIVGALPAGVVYGLAAATLYLPVARARRDSDSATGLNVAREVAY